MSAKSDINDVYVMQIITGLRVGGAEKVLLDLVSNDHAKYQQIVVNVSGYDDLTKIYPFPSQVIYIKGGNKVFSLITLFIKIIGVIKNKKVQVVHAHMFHAMLFACLLKIVTFNQIKIVFTPHTTNFSKIRMFIIKQTKIFRQCDVLLGRTIQSLPFFCQNSIVIPNGVNDNTYLDLPLKSAAHSPFHIIHIGRFFEPKNHLGLVDIVEQVIKKGYLVTVTCVGIGPLMEEVKEKIKGKNLEPHFEFLGLRNDIPQLLAQADCFILPSLWEGLPISLLEAGLAGVPCLVTPVGDIPSLFDEKSIFMAELEDFSTALISMIDNYTLALQRAVYFKDIIQRNYTASSMVAGYVKIYDACIN